MRSVFLVVFALLIASAASARQAQTPPVPKPFPQPGQNQPAAQAPAQAQPRPGAAAAQAQSKTDSAPTAESLGVPIFENAQFLTSYDAGQGQRYYLFGTNASYQDVVSFYRNALRDRGEEVFEEPPVYEFDIGKFKEDTMAFPPSVTVKDYTWGGMQGYLNPVAGGQAQRFRTIIQIVPNPPQ